MFRDIIQDILVINKLKFHQMIVHIINDIMLLYLNHIRKMI